MDDIVNRNIKQSSLVTGSAGFIGFHLAKRLLDEGHSVIGIDNFNDYYSVNLKEDRNSILEGYSDFKCLRLDIFDGKKITQLFGEYQFSTVYHLAAQAGVRYSLTSPHCYLKNNVDGTLNILEAARLLQKPPHLLMASSSSVYGLSKNYPFREDDSADQPVSLYGATKRANELMGHSYSHLFSLPITFLRFFTVYGPWGRPDMAPYKFAEKIFRGDEIEVYNNGDMIRDFTFIEDIIDGIVALGKSRENNVRPSFEVFNIGCAQPRLLTDFILAMEHSFGRKAKIKFLPFQPGDVYKTYADISKIKNICGYSPRTDIEAGVAQFVRWYLDYIV